MKVCPNCGAECIDTAKFCTSCGAPVAADEQAAVERTAESPAYYEAAPKAATLAEFLKLPENTALAKQAKTSGIISYVCAALTALITIVVGGNVYGIVDVILLLAFGLGVHLKKSRVCAILLLIYAVINVVVTLISTGKFQGYLILLAGIYAVVSTFKIDKSWKEYQTKI